MKKYNVVVFVVTMSIIIAAHLTLSGRQELPKDWVSTAEIDGSWQQSSRAVDGSCKVWSVVEFSDEKGALTFLTRMPEASALAAKVYERQGKTAVVFPWVDKTCETHRESGR